MTMNSVFAPNGSPGNQAPKRSNSGREILYLQHNRVVGSNQPVQDAYLNQQHPTHIVNEVQIPQDVADVFNTVLRQYSFRDVYRWLKIDRQDELRRYSTQIPQDQQQQQQQQQQQHQHMHSHHSSHVHRGSVASSSRNSRTSSLFSMGSAYNRDSFASSRTNYSTISEHGEPEQMMSPNPMMGHASMVDPNNAHMMNRNSTASRSSSLSVGKNAARQRENDLEVKKRYFCTACNKGFARKYDWKVHEQRYHEQQFQYPCPDCNQILYAETHFRSHHRDAHGCQQCTHAKEVTKEVDPRRRRTAWGCGFCAALLEDWEKRCDHISTHYDEGMKREQWDHSKVILGLLRQEGIDASWQNHLIAKHGHHPNPPLAVRFSKETTARSHGDSLQLQDMLELGAIGRDVNSIVQLAYEQGVRNPPPETQKSLDPVKEEPVSSSSSSISPITDAPQDSVMGSPSLEQASLVPPQSNTFFVSSPMEFSQSQPDLHQASPMNLETASIHSMFTFGSNGFNDSLYQNSHFISAPPTMATYPEKALPPIPPESDVTMMQTHTPEPHNTNFDQWSLLAGTTFGDDGSGGMVLQTFDPRNQF